MHRIARAFLCAGTLLSVACGSGGTSEEPATQTAAPDGVRMPLADFARFQWLQGSWRGEGVDQPPFYERYTVIDDSTMRVESFPDSTLTGSPEVGEVRWRDGIVTTGSENRVYVATEYDADMIRFEPVSAARNSFFWQRESDDAWTAILSLPVAGSTQVRERVYRMKRWP